MKVEGKDSRLAATLAVLFALVVVAVALPVFAGAANNPAIASFAAENPVATLTVEQGTAQEDLGLPATLEATLAEDGTTVSVPVTWSATYDPNTPGDYTLTATPAGYDLGDVAAPTAKVTVTAVTEDEQVDEDAGIDAQSDEDVDKAYIADWKLDKIEDGTAPFDTSEDSTYMYYKDANGNDENASNKRVRSFDTITYDFTYRTEPYKSGAAYTEGTIYFEFVLPMKAEEAEWNTSSMGWMNDGWKVTTENRTYDFDGDGTDETVSCQVLSGKRVLEGNGKTVIQGSGTLNAIVNVLASQNGRKVNPTFTVWLDGNKAGETDLTSLSSVTANETACTEHNKVEQKTIKANGDNTVTVTAAPRYNVQVKQGSSSGESYTATSYFNFNVGNSYALDMNAGESVYGRAVSYGVTIQLYNNPDRGFKGIEYPSGPITLELELSVDFQPASRNLTDAEKEAVAQDFAPLVLSWGPQSSSSTQYDGRTLTDFGLYYAVFQAPGNKNTNQTAASIALSGSADCYNGGTWTASKSGNTIKLTISDYEIKYPIFPNRPQGYGNATSTYYDYTTGLTNVGCFSAAKIFVVTPFYSNGTSDASKKGEHILDYLGVTAGNFKSTLKDVKLTATSVSGQTLKTVTDNSNQMVTNDDVRTVDIGLLAPGDFNFNVAWTMQTSQPDNRHKDVLGNTDGGSWSQNGQDTLVIGSSVGIGSGFQHNENGFASNRLYAADILCKFDGAAVTLTGGTPYTTSYVTSATNGSNFDVTFLYAVKPDGTNWKSDTEMNAAKIKDLNYYSTVAEARQHGTIVAYLTEYRPKGGVKANLKKYVQGARCIAYVPAKVNNDSNLVGNVYQTCIGGVLWREAEYDAAMKNGGIPTLANKSGSSVTLPAASITQYQQYTKTVYNTDGTISGHTGTYQYGDSLLITAARTKIVKQVAQKDTSGNTKVVYDMDYEQRYADFVLTPSFTDLPAGVSATTNVTITDTLPAGLSYVAGSAYLGGTYVQAEKQGRQGSVTGGKQVEPEISEPDADGNVTLTWFIQNVNTAEGIPHIYYSTEIGTKGVEDTDVKNNQEITGYATVRSTGEKGKCTESAGNKASATIKVSKLKAVAVSKVTEKKLYEPGESRTYVLSVNNNGDSAATDQVVLESLPYKGDSRGSNFTGKLLVTKVEFDTSEFSNASEWECYYTTDTAVRETSSYQYQASDIKAGSSTVTKGGASATVTWKKATVATEAKNNRLTVSGVPDDGTVTAIVWVGTINTKETFTARVTTKTPDSEGGEVASNGLSRGEDETEQRTTVVVRSLSGLPFYDADYNGQRSSKEEILEGVTIKLMKKNTLTRAASQYEVVTDTVTGEEVAVTTAKSTDPDGTSKKYVIEGMNSEGTETINFTVTATATAEGGYIFSGVPSGDFCVQFTAENVTYKAASGRKRTIKFARFLASPVAQGEKTTDSDATPSYTSTSGVTSSTWSLGATLNETGEDSIDMPKTEDMVAASYTSNYHDSGFLTRSAASR